MTITVKVGKKDLEKSTENTSSDTKTNVILSLNARKTIDGHIMIMDHDEIDIVVIPNKNKIITFPKKSFQDATYGSQDRLFNFLNSKGVIARDSIRAGNVYGSMEAKIPDPLPGINAIQLAVFSIGKFLEEEKPHIEMEAQYEKEFEDFLVNPDEKDSTELGEVPQKTKQGSIPKYMDWYKTKQYTPYGY